MSTLNVSAARKKVYRKIGFILLSIFLVLILFDLITYFIQCEKIRADYKEANNAYASSSVKLSSIRRNSEYSDSSLLIEVRLPDYSLFRIVSIFFLNLPFTILMVYCFFFHNRYAGKYIYFLTTGAGAWVCLILSVSLIVSPQSLLYRSEQTTITIAIILLILCLLLLSVQWLLLFMVKAVLPSKKIEFLASALPFVLCGLLGISLVLILIQQSEFTYTSWQLLFSGIGSACFMAAFYPLWQAESSHASSMILRQHGTINLYNNLRQLHINASNGNMTPAEFEQQKTLLLNTFCHTAPLTKAAEQAQQPVPAVPNYRPSSSNVTAKP